jgi:hypothetical protein
MAEAGFSDLKRPQLYELFMHFLSKVYGRRIPMDGRLGRVRRQVAQFSPGNLYDFGDHYRHLRAGRAFLASVPGSDLR